MLIGGNKGNGNDHGSNGDNGHGNGNGHGKGQSYEQLQQFHRCIMYKEESVVLRTDTGRGLFVCILGCAKNRYGETWSCRPVPQEYLDVQMKRGNIKAKKNHPDKLPTPEETTYEGAI
jgi:hypothetical protein